MQRAGGPWLHHATQDPPEIQNLPAMSPGPYVLTPNLLPHWPYWPSTARITEGLRSSLLTRQRKETGCVIKVHQAKCGESSRVWRAGHIPKLAAAVPNTCPVTRKKSSCLTFMNFPSGNLTRTSGVESLQNPTSFINFSLYVSFRPGSQVTTELLQAPPTPGKRAQPYWLICVWTFGCRTVKAPFTKINSKIQNNLLKSFAASF